MANYIYLRVLVPYLNNPSAKTIIESREIKEQHETIKLLNEEVRVFQQWILTKFDKRCKGINNKRTLLLDPWSPPSFFKLK